MIKNTIFDPKVAKKAPLVVLSAWMAMIISVLIFITFGIASIFDPSIKIPIEINTLSHKEDDASTQIVSHNGFSFVLPGDYWQFRTKNTSADGKLTAYIYGINEGIYDKACKKWYPTISIIFETIPEDLSVDDYAQARMSMQGIDSDDLEVIGETSFPLLTKVIGFVVYNPPAGKVARVIYAKSGISGVQIIAEYPLLSFDERLAEDYALIFSSMRFGRITQEESLKYISHNQVLIDGGSCLE